MTDAVSVPAWLLVLIAALAVWALYEHLLMPALRFLVTHPANRVIDELGERLRIGIRPFQRTKRQALIHRLLTDPRVQVAAENFAKQNGVSVPAALRAVERYIAMATEAGVPQALFPEGGLTRDGRMRAPKLGVIDYTMRGFRLEGEHDLVFVPLGINYDRVLEDRSLLRSLEVEAPRVGRAKTLWNTLAFVAHNLRLVLKSEWHRFGYACVNFGSPISMRAYCRERAVDFQRLSGEDRKRETAALGAYLMQEVAPDTTAQMRYEFGAEIGRAHV